VRRGLAGIEPTPARPNGAEYARLNLSDWEVKIKTVTVTTVTGPPWHRRREPHDVRVRVGRWHALPLGF
jgi:hypothetical protein